MIDQKILAQFNGKRILVTGGTGLIGRELLLILRNCGAEVTSVSLDRLQPVGGIDYKLEDLSNLDVCLALTKNKNYVFHVAGIKGSVEVTKSQPASFFVNLLMMNTNILESCRVNEVEKVVYTSSVGAYSSAEVFREDCNREGPPMDEFPGLAKRMAEKQVEAYKIQYGIENFAIVRPANIYGPGDNFDPNNAMVIPSLMHRIRSGEDPVIIWGDGSAIRDFGYSGDIAEGIILALHHGTGGDFVNLGSGKGVSIKELVEILNGVVDFNYEFNGKSGGFPKRVMDISLAKEKLGYEPSTSLSEGLRNTWEWFLENSNEYLNRKNYFVEGS